MLEINLRLHCKAVKCFQSRTNLQVQYTTITEKFAKLQQGFTVEGQRHTLLLVQPDISMVNPLTTQVVDAEVFVFWMLYNIADGNLDSAVETLPYLGNGRHKLLITIDYKVPGSLQPFQSQCLHHSDLQIAFISY